MYWANVIRGHIKVAHIADLNCVVVLIYLCLVLPFFLVLEVDVLIGKERFRVVRATAAVVEECIVLNVLVAY
jgi:hypothetical protein